MEFRKLNKGNQSKSYEESINQTPNEALENAYQQLYSLLASELLQTIKNCSASFFEQIVIDLLLAMGYGGSKQDAGQRIGQTGDKGIDGIIKEDKLGLDIIYIQAKCWRDKTIGRPEIQQFAGALQGQRAHKGVFITTTHFTKEALGYVESISAKIILIDGAALAKLMIEHNVGLLPMQTYEVKRINLDYFLEE